MQNPESEKHEQQRSIEEKLENGIKVVILGVPGSGKSIMLHAIQQQMGNEAARLDVTHGDGEGTWLHNDYQSRKSLRRKTILDKEGIGQAVEQVRDFHTPLTLVDVGGKINPENEAIIREATHALVLSPEGDTEHMAQYTEFAKDAGLDVIGTLYTNPGKRKQSRVAFELSSKALQGLIGGVSRREPIVHDEALDVKAVAETLRYLVASNHYYSSVESGQGHTLVPIDIIRQISHEDNLGFDQTPQLYETIANLVHTGERVRLDGRARSWEYGALMFAAREAGARSVEFYSPDGYVPIEPLQSKVHPKEHAIADISHRQIGNTHIVDIALHKAKIHPEERDQMVLPDIPEGDTVVISGRVPMWLAASAALTYEDHAGAIGYFVPGESSVPIVWSRDRARLSEPVLLTTER